MEYVYICSIYVYIHTYISIYIDVNMKMYESYSTVVANQLGIAIRIELEATGS